MLEYTPEIEIPVVTVTTITLSLGRFKEQVLLEILKLMHEDKTGHLDAPEQQLVFDQCHVVSPEDAVQLSPESYPAIATNLSTTLGLPSLRMYGGTQFVVNTADFKNSGMLKRMLVEYSESLPSN